MTFKSYKQFVVHKKTPAIEPAFSWIIIAYKFSANEHFQSPQKYRD